MTHRQLFDFYICSCSPKGGLVRATLDSETGKIERGDKYPIDRAMYAIKHEGELIAITREGGGGNFGALFTFAIGADGSLIEIGEKLNTGGVVPCHLDANGDDIYVVNYLSGNVCHIGGKTITHEGKGPHPTRQTAPHTHCARVAPDENVLVTDLGLDTVFVYDKSLNYISSAKVPAGYGARHIVFSEDRKHVYCANELVSSITVFEYEGGELMQKETYPAAPEMAGNTAAAIRLYGDKLYVSNRGHDSVAIFKVEGGKLTFEKYVKTYGSEPRDFDVFGKYIVATNQRSNNVTVVDINTGALISEIEAIEPLCITKI